MEKGTLSKVSVTPNMSLITINKADFSKVKEIINALSKINIMMITLSQSDKDTSSLTFAVADSDADAAVNTLKDVIPGVYDIEPSNTKITVHGSGFKNTSSGVNSMLDSITISGAEVKLFSVTDTEISVIVDKKHVNEIERILNGQY